MGSVIGSVLGADMIQASGQASLADLVQIEPSKYTGVTHYLQLQCDLDME